jgi:hypothetical protein
VIRDNKYRYKWSDATVKAKEAYDSEVNSAESFLQHLQNTKVVGFYNYQRLKQEYDNWCAAAGLLPLGVMSLKRTMTQAVSPMRKTVRTEHGLVHRYFFSEVLQEDLVWLDNGYGMRETKEAKSTKPAQSTLSPEW